MNKPKVSIVIPVYNVEPYVEDCIKSVMRQTYDGWMECIVVDDGGMDDSIAVVERMIAEYDGPIQFKILHHDHNRGLSAARNTGVDTATGDYVFFLDSDDELTDDCIEKLTEPLKTEWYDVVTGSTRNVNLLSPNELEETRNIGEETVANGELLRDSMPLRTYRKEWRWEAWNKLCRTEFLRKFHIRFKDGIIFEDVPWTFEIACLARSLYIIGDTTYIYKKRKGSIMDTCTKEKYIRYYPVIIKETARVVDAYRIKNVVLFPFFNNLFSTVLGYTSEAKSKYVLEYKSLRPFVKANLNYIILTNRFHVKRLLHDVHYLLPKRIAPYWQYNVYVRRKRIVKKMKAKFHISLQRLRDLKQIKNKWLFSSRTNPALN